MASMASMARRRRPPSDPVKHAAENSAPVKHAAETVCGGNNLMSWCPDLSLAKVCSFYKNDGWPFSREVVILRMPLEASFPVGMSNRAIVRDFADIENSVHKISITIQRGV